MRFSPPIWVFILLSSCFTLLFGRQPSVSAATVPKPVLVLREGLDGPINEWSGPAKFVLYDDGTVFTETSDETSERAGYLRYFQTHLTPTQASRLIRSLGVKKIIGTSERQYGQGEGVTWQLIYWGSASPGKITIIDSLKQAPEKVVKLIHNLELYPKRGARYLHYDYLLTFSNPQEQTSIPWPKTWHSIKFAKQMLAGVRYPDGVYEYRLDAPHALELITMLAKAKAQCISVNGHIWHATLSPAPRLPNDLFWVNHPV